MPEARRRGPPSSGFCPSSPWPSRWLSGPRPAEGFLPGLLIGPSAHLGNDTSCPFVLAEMKSAPQGSGQKLAGDFLFGE